MRISELVEILNVLKEQVGDVEAVVRASISLGDDRTHSCEARIDSLMNISDQAGARVAIDTDDIVL